MPVRLVQDDTLSHLKAEEGLAAKVASVNGCFTVVSVVELCYRVESDAIHVSAKLKTPLGDVDLGRCALSLENPSCTLGGGMFGFKAEVELTFDVKAMSLHVRATACVPYVGCAVGELALHL
jgi:hypothetical protein